MRAADDRASASVTSLFSGGGEVGRVMADRDWSTSPVGPPQQWPAALRNAVRVVLGSRFSMWLGWGPELTFFYNDAYQRETLRAKHPWAIGRPAREVWAEIWDDVHPRIRTVLDTGAATWDEQLPLRLERAGYPEETYHTFSYSPLADDGGRVAGILCVVREDTERVLGERRLRVLSELGTITAVAAPTVEQACAAAAEVLARNRQDVPFGAIYLLDDGAAPGPAASFGLREDLLTSGDGPARSDGTVSRPPDPERAGAAVELTERQRAAVEPLDGPMGAADPRLMVRLPLAGAGGGGPTGLLLAGVSPFRALDDEYHRFLGLVARQINAAISDAQTFQAQRRRAEELTELDRAKTEFFTGVSHELRTPLTLIAGPADDALADPEHPLPPEQRTRLELISRNAGRLRRLVDSLLEISQAEAGRLVPNPVAVDLAALTRGVAESFAPAVRRGGLEFVIDCPALDVAVAVDPDMWERIVLNLLSNALKFTPTGRVALSVGRSGSGAVELRVTDTGIGIPAEEQPRLFERFHRVRGATGRSHEGSGIGLALVAELTELHGGSVAVRSTPGVGSTFTVLLPASACTERPPVDRESLGPVHDQARAYRDEADQWGAGGSDPVAAAAPPVGSGAAPPAGADAAVVLVAEDNADLRRFIADRLAPHYRVLLAPDGTAALELARATRPDLVLSDVMMPGLDGFQLLDGLRSHPDTATVPVILLSARAGPEAVVQGLANGADDYLVKPFSGPDLLARVHSTLTLARLRGQEGAWRGALLNAITDGVVVLDEDGALVELNSAFTDITGYGAEGLPYRAPYPWWPDPESEPDEHAHMLRAFERLTGGGANRLRTPLRHRDGRRVWVETSTAQLPAGLGANRRTVAVVRDVTESHRAAKRNRLLADTGRALIRSGDLPGRLDQCVRAAAAVLDELVLVIESRPHGRWVVAAAAHRGRPDLVRAVLRCRPGRVPAAHRARYRAGRAVVLDPGPAELLGTGPAAEAARALLGEHSVLLAPVTAGGRVHGSLAIVSVGRRRDAADEDLAMAEELGRRIAGALDTERRAQLEHRLHEASVALAAAATLREAAAALADAVRESTDAAVAMVYTPDPNDASWLRLRHIAAADPQPWDLFDSVRLGSDVPAGEVARTGLAAWLADRRTLLEHYPRLAGVTVLRHLEAVAALPIGTGEQVGGVLVVGFDTPRTFPTEERRFVAALVAQAGQALTRASRSDDRWRVSQLLQDSLLPAALPTLDRLSLVAHYLPAGRDIHAGGDWYDVVALDDTQVAIMVGDVVGNGPVAAATMGRLSSALGAYLREGHGPARALDLLGDYALNVPQALGSTAVCLVLDTGTGEARGASAGHPPPLLLDPGRSERVHYWDELRGVSLGVPGAPRRAEARITLSPGGSVLLYTDGLVERRRESIDDGLARLAAATAPHLDAAPAELRSAALAGCLPESGPSDDVALVIARYLPAPLEARIPSRPDQLAVVRDQVRSWAAAVGLPRDSTYDLQLALGEALANAIEHGYRDRPGIVSYRLSLTDNREVRARVRDHGDWRPPTADRGFRGRGLELLRAVAGDVNITPAEDQGTVVEFTMPWTVKPAAALD